MSGPISSISLLVHDYDEAIRYFTQVLDFVLLEDAPREANKRWVRVAPASGGCALLLARADGPEQHAAAGNQTGGRVFLFLETRDFDADYARFQARGVEFTETPREEPYGKVVVFRDLYGNRWDLLEASREDTHD